MPKTYTIEQKVTLLHALIDFTEDNEKPFLKKFTYDFNISLNTLHRWATEEEPVTVDRGIVTLGFSEALEKNRDKMECYYENKGDSTGRSFYIFMLKAKFGYRDSDKVEIPPANVTINNISNLTDKELDEQMNMHLQRLQTANRAKNDNKTN